MRPDDNAAANSTVDGARKRIGHEGSRFADRDDAQRSSIQPGRNWRILSGAIDQMVRRRGFNRAARDGQKMMLQ
jgi:hypothetical protein